MTMARASGRVAFLSTGLRCLHIELSFASLSRSCDIGSPLQAQMSCKPGLLLGQVDLYDAVSFVSLERYSTDKPRPAPQTPVGWTVIPV